LFFNQSIIDKKDSLYKGIKAYCQPLSGYPGSRRYVMKWLLLFFKGRQYKWRKKPENKWMKRKADKICDSALPCFPHSNGGT